MAGAEAHGDEEEAVDELEGDVVRAVEGGAEAAVVEEEALGLVGAELEGDGALVPGLPGGKPEEGGAGEDGDGDGGRGVPAPAHEEEAEAESGEEGGRGKEANAKEMLPLLRTMPCLEAPMDFFAISRKSK